MVYRSLLVSPSPDLPLSAFREAEAMQQEMQPQYPLLYSQGGYRYCDLLLESREPVVGRSPDRPTELTEGLLDHEGRPAVVAVAGSGDPATTERADDSPEQALARIREVRNRAETTLRYLGEFTNMGLLDFGLNHLTLGRTYLVESRVLRVESEEGDDSETLNRAEQHLNESVSLLRQAGRSDYLPTGLLHRAALWREAILASGGREPTDDSTFDSPSTDRNKNQGTDVPRSPEELLSLAERDLSEAESIVGRGSMLIFQIEAALERARSFLMLASANSASLRFNQSLADTAETQRTPSDWLKLAREKLDETRRLVKETERPYEPYVPDWDEWEPPEYVGVFKAGEIVGYHCRNGEIERLQKLLTEGGS